MMNGVDVQYRLARASDAPAVAELHADSWKRHYRGAYSDAYLDGDVVSDRLAAWADRMGHLGEDQFTIVAEIDGRLAGFVHAILDADPIWGALVDNLHVAYGLKRSGIGTRLLGAAAQILLERRPSQGLYLFVLEQNEAAQGFYESQGGVRAGREITDAPGGDLSRLVGTPAELRYAWTDPSVLVSPLHASTRSPDPSGRILPK